MLAYLKNQPVLGLAVAVTSGLVLAHFIIRAVDSLYDDYPSLPYIAASFILLSVAIRLRRPLLTWLCRHKGKLAVAAVTITALYLFGVYRADQNEKYLKSMAQPNANLGSPVYLDQSTGVQLNGTDTVPPTSDKCASDGIQVNSVVCTKRRELQKLLHIPPVSTHHATQQ